MGGKRKICKKFMRKIKVTKIKSLSTPYKIIKILNIMTKNPVSIDEILSTFENEGIFIERETISKYFATLRNAGCNIQKKRNKFYIIIKCIPIKKIYNSNIDSKNSNSISNEVDYLIFKIIQNYIPS